MVSYVAGPVRVRVPASSANLGPGFDALGLALGLHDVVAAEVTGAELVITAEGEGVDDLPRDETHLVHRAMTRGFEALGASPPGLRLHCVNSIPHGRGLGSSSAAIVGGLALARALVVDGARRLDDQTLFGLAAEIEGHPDNVAPAVFGGLTIAYSDSSGAYAAACLEVTSPLSFVALVPTEPLTTRVARELLPHTVPHKDAAFNAGRAALVVAALTGRPDHLLSATEDRLHQTQRAAAMPASAELIAALRSHGVAAVVSGAGPTVLAIVSEDRVAEVLGRAPGGWSAMQLEVDGDGVTVLR